MSLKFNEQPGSRERHLKRKANNPLFPEAAHTITQEDILQARQQDEIELLTFMDSFQILVQDAVNLKPETDSEVLLELKERLDKSYAQCCTLAGDQAPIKEATAKLINSIMDAVQLGAKNDFVALGELEEETIARKSHFELHNHKLVADLMLVESPINSDELIASLLSAQDDELIAALNLFDKDMLTTIYQQAKSLLQSFQGTEDISSHWERLSTIETFLTQLTNENSLVN